jgi:hypothetical protein
VRDGETSPPPRYSVSCGVQFTYPADLSSNRASVARRSELAPTTPRLGYDMLWQGAPEGT